VAGRLAGAARPAAVLTLTMLAVTMAAMASQPANPGD
jgi:hypothetical protein